MVLNRIWPVVNDRLNFFTSTKKPVQWRTDRLGRRTRVYGDPKTPFQRLLEAGVLSPAQERELLGYPSRPGAPRQQSASSGSQMRASDLSSTSSTRVER